MLNAQKVPNDFIEAFRPVLSKFKGRYNPGNFGVSSFSRENLYSICVNFFLEVAEAGLTSDDVAAHGLSVLNDEKHSRFPPNPRQFALELRSFAHANAEDADFDESLLKLFDWLGRRYSGLWHGPEEKAGVVSDWASFLSELECTDYDVNSVVKKIRNSSEHSKYPPSSAEIEKYLRISSLKIDIPSASEAYLDVTRNSDISKLPLIVRYARRVFGSYALRTRTDQSVRRDFISLYNTIIDDYLSGDLDLDRAFQEKSCSTSKGRVDEPRMSKSELSKLISRM